MTTKQSSSDALDDESVLRQILLDMLTLYAESEKPMNETLLKMFVELSEDKIQAWHLQKCRSYLPSKIRVDCTDRELCRSCCEVVKYNQAIDEITKRIEG